VRLSYRDNRSQRIFQSNATPAALPSLPLSGWPHVGLENRVRPAFCYPMFVVKNPTESNSLAGASRLAIHWESWMAKLFFRRVASTSENRTSRILCLMLFRLFSAFRSKTPDQSETRGRSEGPVGDDWLTWAERIATSSLPAPVKLADSWLPKDRSGLWGRPLAMVIRPHRGRENRFFIRRFGRGVQDVVTAP